MGLGADRLEDSSSDCRLKSSWSLRVRSRGEEEKVEVEERRGRLLGGSGGLGLITAETACCNSFAHFHRSVPGSAGGRLGVALEAL